MFRVVRSPLRGLTGGLALAAICLCLLPSGVAPGHGMSNAHAAPSAHSGDFTAAAAGAAPDSTSAVHPGSIRGSFIVGGYLGLNSTASGCTCARADLTLAVGHYQTLEMVDSRAAIYTTYGAPVSNASLASFAGAGSDFLAEAQARYDPGSARFYAVIHDVTNNSLLVGGSTGPNASAAWRWHFLPAARSGDRLAAPSLGVTSSVLGVAATVTNASTGARFASVLWVLNKSSVTSSGSPTSVEFGPSATYAAGARAVESIGVANTQYFVSENLTAGSLTRIAATGLPPAPVSLAWTNTSIAPRVAPVPSNQLGSPDLLAAPLPGVSDALWQGGNLTITGTASSAGVDRIQLVQVNTSSGQLRQDLLLGNGASLSYPALSADTHGDLAIVADITNATMYPSLAVAGQPFNEPNATTAFGILAPGSAPVTSDCNVTLVCAWGNSSAAAADPNDPAESWVAGEYSAGGGANWSTIVGIANFPPLAIGLVTSDLPTVDAGQFVNFSAFITGGTGAYEYVWGAGLPTGCTVQNTPSIECRPTVPGGYNITLTVRDSAGTSVTSSPYAFSVAPELTVARPLANRTSADVGQAASFRAGIAGGSPAYLYLWTAPLGARCTGTNTPTFNCTFTQSSVARVVLAVTDQNLAVVANASAFTVYPDPELTNLTASPSTLESGNSLAIGARVVSFGSGGDDYRWTGLPPGCSPAPAPNITCIPASAGSFEVQLTMNDSNGVAVTSAVTIVVSAPPVTVTSPINLGLLLGIVVVGLAVAGILVAVVVRRRRLAAGER